jgi:hypothetical protein
VAQDPGQLAPDPSHAKPPAHAGFPAVPEATIVQVPSAVAPSDFAHASQGPAHAALQQKPSDAKPLAHWVPSFAACGCPVLSLQAPAASHVCVPVHVLGSSALVIGWHTPPTSAHWWHGPHGAQHRLVACVSQTPEPQLKLAVQACPAGDRT